MSQQTQADYRQRMLRAMRLIEERLDEPVTLTALAGAAHFSPYHFHRIFTGMAGESVMAYVRRLRLARAAYRLTYTNRAVTDIGLDAGFEAAEAFSRAFKAAFGRSPSGYRQRTRLTADGIAALPTGEDLLTTTKEFCAMDVTVKHLPPIRVACLRHVGPYNECGRTWEQLCGLIGQYGLFSPDTRFLGVSHDDPEVTAPDKIRYDACVTVPESFAGTPELPVAAVGGGEYACAVHQGPYTGLAAAYAAVCGGWGPGSGREFAAAPSVEFYLNDPKVTPPEALLTEICVPLEPRR